jgi:hypothetical protein
VGPVPGRSAGSVRLFCGRLPRAPWPAAGPPPRPGSPSRLYFLPFGWGPYARALHRSLSASVGALWWPLSAAAPSATCPLPAGYFEGLGLQQARHQRSGAGWSAV